MSREGLAGGGGGGGGELTDFTQYWIKGSENYLLTYVIKRIEVTSKICVFLH